MCKDVETMRETHENDIKRLEQTIDDLLVAWQMSAKQTQKV